MRLTADQVKKAESKGLYSDGGGLFLQVSTAGTKSWIYRYQLAKKRRDMGLGSFPAVGLAAARKLRDKAKLEVRAGIDPLQKKQELKDAAAAKHREEETKLMTFARCADEFIGQKESEWKSAKHGQQWRNTLATYAAPAIGDLPISEITVDHVLKVLLPIWETKTETATRVRTRIEMILDYAKVKKYRTGENAALWRGNLAHLLPKPSKVRKVKHHTALPYDDLPAFMVELKAANGLAAQALQLTILCGTRTSETLNATWSEIDLSKKLWVIPAERMKAEKEHRIPLSEPAATLLSQLRESSTSDYIFPGLKQGKPLSNMAMTTVLRRMGKGDLTVHGFRSTFRDWIAEKTNFPRRVAETALAHKLKDGAEAAYQRGDLMEKRREMMRVWAMYCFPEASNVVQLRAAK